VKAVIFDHGDVLCLPPTREEIEGSARILGIGSDLYRDLWIRNRDVYDRGDFSAEAYWRKFAEAAGKPLDAAQIEELNQRDLAMYSRNESQHADPDARSFGRGNEDRSSLQHARQHDSVRAGKL
jgi:hypothetical protein